MSKNAKKRRAEKRKAAKRSRKEARKALYKSYAENGRETGSRRYQKQKAKVGSTPPKRHRDCGNVGCLQCFPEVHNLTPGRQKRVERGLLSLGDAIAETFKARGM